MTKLTHIVLRINDQMTPEEIARKAEEELQRLEGRGWRLSHAGIWQHGGVVYARMWKED